MRTEAQTSMHLLMVSTLSIVSVLLSLMAVIMSWELWMLPIIIIGCLTVWWLHIGGGGFGHHVREHMYRAADYGFLLFWRAFNQPL